MGGNAKPKQGSAEMSGPTTRGRNAQGPLADGSNKPCPVHKLTFSQLECIAETAISRWIVLVSQRIAERPGSAESQKLSTLLLG
jgi:hypothetical protein